MRRRGDNDNPAFSCLGWGENQKCETPHLPDQGGGRCARCYQINKRLNDAKRAADIERQRMAAQQRKENPMAIEFQVYKEPMRRNGNGGNKISIRTDGRIYLSTKVMEKLGNPPFVELLFSNWRKTVGVRPCDGDLPHARTVARNRKSSKGHQTSIAARDFLLHHELGDFFPCIAEAKYQDNIVYLHMKAAGAGEERS